MKQIKNIRYMFSRVSKAGFFAVILVWAASCKEAPIGQISVDDVPPPQVSNIQITPAPGGATISYDLPDETDLSYVYCEYEIDGVKKNTRSSVYLNSLVIEGLPDTDECEFTLYMVDHSENFSEPYNGSFIPEEPIYLTVFSSLVPSTDFGGSTFFFNNPTRASIGAFTIARNDYGEWEDYDFKFSSLENDRRSIRGYNTDEREFGIILVDQWDNYSDTLIFKTNPYFEEEMDKKKWSDASLPGDNMTGTYDRVKSRIWDGNTSSDDISLWHTDAAAGIMPPQTFTIDMGIEGGAQLSRMKLWNRSNYAYRQHNPRLFKIWGCLELPHDRFDAAYWNPHTGTWRDDMILLGDFEQIKPSGLPPGDDTPDDLAAEAAGFEYSFDLEAGQVPPQIRYIRVEVVETWQQTGALHIAEISFYGDDGDDSNN